MQIEHKLDANGCVSDTEIIVTTPAIKDGKSGPVPVTVGTANVWFTYVAPPIVESLKPDNDREAQSN